MNDQDLWRGKTTERSNYRKLLFKTIVLWFVILVIASFAASLQSRQDPVGIQVAPAVPREGQPIFVTFSLDNPMDHPSAVDYSLFANGEQVMRGSAELAPSAGRQFQYVYSNPLKIGEQITFVMKTQSASGIMEKSVSVPAYHPSLLSSFVSFASFATSELGSSTSLSSMAYYDESYGTNKSLNVGLVLSIVLILLLIYMELSEPLSAGRPQGVLGGLRARFSRLSLVLFIIFVGMVFTQIALIVGGLR